MCLSPFSAGASWVALSFQEGHNHFLHLRRFLRHFLYPVLFFASPLRHGVSHTAPLLWKLRLCHVAVCHLRIDRNGIIRGTSPSWVAQAMVFHTFSAVLSAFVGSFIFRQFALISFHVLFLSSTHPLFTRLDSRSQSQPQNLGFPRLTPSRTGTENFTDRPLALGSQWHTFRMVNVSIPPPTYHPLLQRPLSSLNALSIPLEPIPQQAKQLHERHLPTCSSASHRQCQAIFGFVRTRLWQGF